MIEDVLEILKERGLVDEGQYNELVAKNQTYEERNQSLLGRIEFSGDMRMRYENFWYSRDELGVDASNRNRLRYRARLQAKAAINDYLDAVFRLASGEGDIRSTNRTLGVGDDFDFDAIFIDLAYLAFNAPKEWLPDTTLAVRAGKMPNPFLWKQSRVDLLWDADITPEGIGVQLGYKPNENVNLFANAGYYIVDENGTASDPHVLGIQGGVAWTVADQVDVGARGTWYSWGSLNAAFFDRMAHDGNVVDGLAGQGATRSTSASWPGTSATAASRAGRSCSSARWRRTSPHRSRPSSTSPTRTRAGASASRSATRRRSPCSASATSTRRPTSGRPASRTATGSTASRTARAGRFWATKEILPNTDLNVEPLRERLDPGPGARAQHVPLRRGPRAAPDGHPGEILTLCSSRPAPAQEPL